MRPWWWLRPTGAGCLLAWARYHFLFTPEIARGSSVETYFWAPWRCLCSPACFCTPCLQKLHGPTHPCCSFSTLCSVKLLSRFLHDKNSREFLYYRKKVAEIRKEAQKLQAAPQKGRWAKGVGSSGEACRQTTPHVELGFLSWSPPWHGVALTVQVCARPGSWGHAGTSTALVAIAPRSGEM